MDTIGATTPISSRMQNFVTASESNQGIREHVTVDLADAADSYSSGDVSMKSAQLLVALHDTYGSRILTPKVRENIELLYAGLQSRRDFSNYDFAHDPLFFVAQKVPPVQDLIIHNLFFQLESQIDEDKLLTVLILLHQLVLTGTVALRGEEVDLIYSFLPHPVIQIADTAAKILVSTLSNVSSEISAPMYWNTIKSCLDSRPQVAYKAWIGWCLSSSSHVKNRDYKELLRQAEYWDLLRQGITIGMKSCECTKYCLQILSASLKDLDFDLDLPKMTWRIEHRQRYLNVWSRYVALVEILCIDTSLNQAEDSADDIVALLHPESLLPRSWAISLLEAGLTSNIRDFVYNLVLELGEPLEVFNESPEFLANKLIPAALQASNFFVEEHKCVYKEKLAAFTARLCTFLHTDQTNRFIGALMTEFSQSVRLYEAPRVILLTSLAKHLPPVLKLDALTRVAHYGGAALLGYKSEAMAKLLLSNCTEIIVRAADLTSLTPSDCLKMVDKLVVNGIETVDLSSIADWMPDSWTAELKLHASLKPAYRALYVLKSKDMLIPPEQEGVDSVVCYLINHGCNLAKSRDTINHVAQKLSQGHYITKTEFSMLSVFPDLDLSVPTPSGPELADMLAYLQASSLRKPLPTTLLLSILDEKGDAKGFMNAERRSLHCNSMRHAFDQITCVDEESWPLLVDLVGRAFLHDEFEPRVAALQCLSRCIDNLSAEVVSRAENIGSNLSSIWLAFKDHKLRASEHHVHLKFIEVLTNPKIVSLELDQKSLEALAFDIIEESYARRDLLTPLIKGLAQTPCRWVSRVMAFSFCFLQTNMQSFHLEELIVKETGRYSDFWGAPDRSAKVIAAWYFSNGHDTTDITKYLLEDKKFLLLSPGKRHDGDEERVRVLAYQLLTLLSPNWNISLASEIASLLLEKAVDVEPSPSARIYVEWIIALTVARDPQRFIDELVLTPLKNNLAPRYVSSLGRIGLLVGKEVTTELKPEFYQDYLTVMLPLATSNRAPVRHFAVAMAYAIHLDSSLRNCVNPLMLSLVDGVASCAATVENFKSFRSGDDCVWSISKCFNLTSICGGLVTRVTGRFMKDRLHHSDFVQVLGPENDYGPESEGEHDGPTTAFHDISMIRDSIRTANENIQTKSGSFDGLQPLKRSELIVVATLCDKPTNLGGICRLCDALGAKLMTLNDLSVSKQQQFKNTAVTADKWMPMQQVTEADLLPYLQEKKREGYTLVGIEQTDNSRKLKPDLKFPVKTVLVMGKEREGVPGEVLAHLDFCVEIEQFGVVRSLNIQTATAVLVHAYNNQH